MKQWFMIILLQQVAYHGHINKHKIINGIIICWYYLHATKNKSRYRDKPSIIMEIYFRYCWVNIIIICLMNRTNLILNSNIIFTNIMKSGQMKIKFVKIIWTILTKDSILWNKWIQISLRGVNIKIYEILILHISLNYKW